jgi:hypothetical protein
MSRIDVFEGNTLSVTVTVTGIASLSGYSANMCVKEFKNSTTSFFDSTGTINGLVITFVITAAQNSIAKGRYYYEATVDNGTNYFTVSQGAYVVKESIKY